MRPQGEKQDLGAVVYNTPVRQKNTKQQRCSLVFFYSLFLMGSFCGLWVVFYLYELHFVHIYVVCELYAVWSTIHVCVQ